MYTSFCANTTGGLSQRSRRGKNQHIDPPTVEEMKEMGKFERASSLHLNQRLMHNKIVVKRIINKSTFIVFHEDFRQEFFLKQIDDYEDVQKWIDIQTHTNIVTAFDQFVDLETGHKFVMSEMTNGGNMYQHIEKLNLDLAMDVPRDYLELIYDVGIQLATAMDFAHNSGLVHGQLDLSEVLVHNNGENLEFKITDFAPQSSMELPMLSEANYWPFAKNKKTITDHEKMEVLMLKDVYSLGICLLEMMIGRFSKKKFSISLDSLPLTWAEFPESTPLIQVLVECIQIDSITNRKGKLQSIRKLLIREFKKYFQRQFYKMECPFIGKKSDFLNKKGIISLFHKKETEQKACSFWQEALSLNDRHFDSKCNEVMYRWSTAKIGDGRMMSELEEFVFQTEHKGQTLKAYLMIAQGDKDQGIELLKVYIEQTKVQIKKDRIPNVKAQRNLKIAEEVLNATQLEKDLFPQNSRIKHQHEEVVLHISFSPDSKVMITTANDEAKIWKFQNGLVIEKNSIKTTEPTDLNQHPLSFSNNNCSIVIVHRGQLVLTVYDCSGQNFVKKDEIDLVKEIIANGNPGFSFSQEDRVTDVRLVEKDTVIRVDFTKKKEFFFIDVQLSDSVAKMRKVKKFEDRSAYTLEAGQGVNNIRQMQEILTLLIDDETRAGNVLNFPSEDVNTVAVLNKDDPNEKFYTIFDIRRNGYFRRVSKHRMDTETFAVDTTGKFLAYIDGPDIIIRSIRIPNHSTLIDTLRPRYQKAEQKLAPASASENKQFFKDKLYRDLHTYHMFKADPLKAEKQSGVTEEINIQLMVHKYEEATKRPYKMKANREFMMMMKILLKEAVKEKGVHGNDNLNNCPLIGVLGTKRIEIYDDELTYISPNSQIKFQEMSSEESRHFFLIQMDQVVYKYDLVTKQLLFQFKCFSSHAMLIYDKDDKLLCANDKTIRLWDFWDQKEQAPELITSCESVLKVEKIYINKNSKTQKDNNLLVLVVCKDEYALYRGRMDFVRKGNTSMHESQNIMCAEFDANSTCFWIGTDRGLLICISVETGLEIGEAYNVSPEIEKPITSMNKFVGIDSDNVFLLVLAKKEVVIYSQQRKDAKPVIYGVSDEEKSYQGKEICNTLVAYNSKFFCIGIPAHRALGFFSFDRIEFTFKPVKWLTKYAFTDFFMDNHLSQLMFLDESRKTLDHHLVLWDFDSTKLDDKHLRRIDNMKMPGAPKQKDCDTESSDDENAEANKLLVDKMNAQSSCCTIF